MPDLELEQLITRLLADAECNLAPAVKMIPLPESLPAEVRHFYARWAGGRLYYRHDFPTPQFGCELCYFDEQPVSRQLPCAGPEFDFFYTIALFTDAGEEDRAVVSTHADTFGQIYRLNFSLGDPMLNTTGAIYLAPTFTRWLAMHVEAWDVYQQDWREGLRHFSRLIQHERSNRRA